MEKIVNMQVQAGMPSSSGIQRRTQNSVQDTKDDFIRLLQQKESAGKPEEAGNARKTEDAIHAGKPEEKQTKEAAEEQVKEPAEEPDVKEEFQDLAQMELQQSILQQAVIQIAEPAVTELQPVAEALPEIPDAIVSDVVQESGELSMEVVALSEQAKPEEVSVKPEAESVKPETRVGPVKTGKADVAESEVKAGPVKEKAQEQMVSRPKEERQETSLTEQRSQNIRAASDEQDTDRNPKGLFPDVSLNQGTDQASSLRSAETPVQVKHAQETTQPGFQKAESTLKTTVEELPQELGKAVMAGKQGSSQVLTVELEPASLGKLTIRLEYEAGKTVVSMMASSSRTLELLSQKASEIALILKDHTGEETVIYTEQPQKEPGEDAQQQNSHGGQQQERRQHRQEEQPQTDSFMQQLRLGLV